MTVYFVRMVDQPEQVKIGSTTSLEKRLRSIARSRGSINLFATCEGNKLEERYFQKRFMKDRIEGEWFQSSPAMMQFVRENCELVDVNYARSGDEWTRKLPSAKKAADAALAYDLMIMKMARFPRSMTLADMMEKIFLELSAVSDGWSRRRVRGFHERDVLRVDFFEVCDLMTLNGLSDEDRLFVLKNGSLPKKTTSYEGLAA